MSPTRTSLSCPTSASPPSSCSLSPREQAGPTYLRRIKAVILESPEKKLSLREIYTALENQPGFLDSRRKGDNGWRNSVRNLLSLAPCFKKVAGETSDAPGRGSYWTIVDDTSETFTRTERLRNNGNSRGRKRQTGSTSTTTRTSNRGGNPKEDHERLASPEFEPFPSPSYFPRPLLPFETAPPSKPLPSTVPLSSPTLHVLLQDLRQPVFAHPLPPLSPPLSTGSSSSLSPPPLWLELEEEVMGSTSPSGGWVFCERVSLMRSKLHGGSEGGEGEGEGCGLIT